MKKSTHSKFAKRYQSALRRHLLNHQPLRAGTLNPAIKLGEAAITLGLDTLDLARLHDRAFAHLDAQPPRPIGGNHTGPVTRAGGFFLDVLAPVEKSHQNAKAGALRAQQLDSALRQKDTALVQTRLKMRKETVRRISGERDLALKVQRYSLLLVEARRLQRQAQRVAHQLLLEQEEERKEISRELHDEVAQILAGINVQLATLNEASALNNRSLRHRVAQTQKLVEHSVQVVHRYALRLRPAMLDDLGLLPAMRSYIKDMPGRKGMEIRFTAFPGVETTLSNTRRTVLYRVAQEALTNIVQHAHAKKAAVSITRLEQAVRMEVRDDGISFNVDKALGSVTNKRLGLLGMRERVEMVGGTFSIDSTPGKGTTVRADIPLRSKRKDPQP